MDIGWRKTYRPGGHWIFTGLTAKDTWVWALWTADRSTVVAHSAQEYTRQVDAARGAKRFVIGLTDRELLAMVPAVTRAVASRSVG